MDSLVEEVRKIRESYAQQFGFDLQAIHRDLKAQEQAGGRRVVSFPPRPPRPIGRAAAPSAGGLASASDQPAASV